MPKGKVILKTQKQIELAELIGQDPDEFWSIERGRNNFTIYFSVPFRWALEQERRKRGDRSMTFTVRNLICEAMLNTLKDHA